MSTIFSLLLAKGFFASTSENATSLWSTNNQGWIDLSLPSVSCSRPTQPMQFNHMCIVFYLWLWEHWKCPKCELYCKKTPSANNHHRAERDHTEAWAHPHDSEVNGAIIIISFTRTRPPANWVGVDDNDTSLSCYYWRIDLEGPL